jgi:hypothetical protein
MNTETPTEDKVLIHKYILDPLSTIIKLSILSKKDLGCKISVSNNIIILQETGIFQSFVRYIFNSNKIDIQYLYNPIELGCSFFLNDKYIKKNPQIKSLFIDAQNGIVKLIETYKNFTIITHTLYLYKNIISNYLSEQYNDKLFIRDNLSNIYNKELVDKLNNMWYDDRIKMVLNMIDFIDKDKGSNKSVKCLEEFMIIVDKESYNLIQNN